MLSLLLAATMVFSMNTFAFGEEKATGKTEAVLLTSGPQKSISSDCFYWNAIEDEEYMSSYFNGWQEAIPAGEKKHFDSDHLIDGKPVTVSYNYGDDWSYGEHGTSSRVSNWLRIRQPEPDKKTVTYEYMCSDFDAGVSSNVFKLDGTHYLMVAYRLEGFPELNKGTNVPVAVFNGKKYVDTSKAVHGKIDKNNSVIVAEAALVEQTAGSAPKLIANTMSTNGAKKPGPMISLTIKPKNNLYANVSMNRIVDEKFNDLGHLPIQNVNLKDGAYPYFTISVKFDKALKDQSKNLKKSADIFGATLNKAEFKFDICRNSFAEYNPNLVSLTQEDIKTEDHHFDGKYGFRHIYPGPNFDEYYVGDDYTDYGPDYTGIDVADKGYWIGQRDLWTDNGIKIGSLDLFTDATKVGKNGLPVYLINTEGEYIRDINSKGWSKKKTYTIYKLKAKKDYEVSTLEGGAVLLKPTGNFEGDGAIFRNVEYTIPGDAGRSYNGKSITKDTKVTELRMGIYNSKTDHWYCDSVD